MEYKVTNPDLIQEGVWDEKSCVRRQGGYDIDKSKLPAGLAYLPKGAVLAFLAVSGKVTAVKTAKVVEEAASGTKLKIDKANIIVVGDVIGGLTVSAIDRSNADYDVLTVSSISEKLNIGDVIADANVSNVCGLNYATVKLDSYPSCTPTIQAYEIEEDTLPYPINNAIKEALTIRHAFKL